MARVVGVHGIAQQHKGAEVLAAAWRPAMADGMTLSGASPVHDGELAIAFYGDLFRPRGDKIIGEPDLGPEDVQEGLELDLLAAWASAGDNGDAVTKARTPMVAQVLLARLASLPFFAGLSMRFTVGALKQVRAYLTDDGVRAAVQERVAHVIDDDTRVMVGHSLGSVVAYESLAAHPEWPVTTLVTLGSPLGIPNLVFDLLRPPSRDGVGVWPGAGRSWTNVSDRADAVALVKALAGPFGEGVRDELVDNGAKAHDVSPYLTARETGAAIASGLDC